MADQTNVSRRKFVIDAAGAASAVAALSAMGCSPQDKAGGTGSSAPLASGKPTAPRDLAGTQRMAFIGVGKMGKSHLDKFVGYKDFVVTAVCDVDTERRELATKFVDDKYAEFERKNVKPCKPVKHYREILDDPDIDVVLIATPDHWHIAIAIEACKAKKDVYCEKPLTLTIEEARRVIEAARKHECVFQVGSQQRTEGPFADAVDMIRSGRIGRIKEIQVGIGATSKPCWLMEEPVRPGLDWNQWLGQAPQRPFHHLLCQQGDPKDYPFNPGWRDYREYSGGNVTDWGAHHIDISHWALDMDRSGPVEARPPKRGMDTYGAELVYKGSPYGADEVVLKHTEVVFTHPPDDKGERKEERNGIRFIGEKGELFVNRSFLRTTPEEIGKEPLSDGERKVARVDGKGMMPHHRNWLDCIRSRQRPIADVEVGARTVTACHLMNLAFWHDAKFQWDPQRWAFTGENADAANKLRTRPRRKGFELPQV